MKEYLLRRKNSIGVAWSGLINFFRSEPHAFIHMMAAILVLTLAWLLSVSSMEWIALVLVIALVVLAEILNTILEKVTDFIQPEIDPRIKVIKDMAAAAVLWATLIAVVIGFIIFTPYLIKWVTG